MKRSMMQIYVDGSDKAVELYQKAFDAELIWSVPNDEGDGTYYHAELNIYGQVLAIAEAKVMLGVQNTPSEEMVSFFSQRDRIPGNTMQFCLHFGESKEDIVHKAYDVLKEGAKILTPLGPCDFSPLMTDFIDKFGVKFILYRNWYGD